MEEEKGDTKGIYSILLEAIHYRRHLWFRGVFGVFGDPGNLCNE
jgi:hypothetical protein